MKNRIFLLVIGSLVVLLILAACSPAASGPSASSFPTGKFLKSGTTSYELILNKDGTFSVFNGGITLVEGTYSVNGNTYTEESNNHGCSTPMKFKYTFDGINLNFNYVGNPREDPCDGRRADFDNQTYTLSK